MSSEQYEMPGIEPLSDLSWRRIEDSVFRALDAEDAATVSAPSRAPSRAWWRNAIAWSAAGAIAAAAIVLLLVRGGEDDGSHTSRVATAEASSMVTIGDASLTVAPHSTVIVNETGAGAVAVMLERGSVHCAVAPRDGRPPFVVHAGDVRVEVVGTKFEVTRVDDSARVVVDEGVVTLYTRGDRLELQAGEVWPQMADAGGPTGPAEPTPMRTADAKTTADAVPEPELELEPDVLPNHADRGATKRDERAKPSAKERYRTAARLESTDPDAALHIYRELSVSGAAWAPPSLYAMGRLQTELGRTSAARQTLRRYVKRYPKGANAEDARSLLKQLE